MNVTACGLMLEIPEGIIVVVVLLRRRQRVPVEGIGRLNIRPCPGRNIGRFNPAAVGTHQLIACVAVQGIAQDVCAADFYFVCTAVAVAVLLLPVDKFVALGHILAVPVLDHVLLHGVFGIHIQGLVGTRGRECGSPAVVFVQFDFADYFVV